MEFILSRYGPVVGVAVVVTVGVEVVAGAVVGWVVSIGARQDTDVRVCVSMSLNFSAVSMKT